MTAWQDLDATAWRERASSEPGALREGIESALASIQAHEPGLQAFHTVLAPEARARAEQLAYDLAAGVPPGPLFGVPVALKSNFCLEGTESNCGSRFLEGYRAPYTATAVQRLLDAGAIVVGMTHMDEFAMGSSGENSAFATSRNPWDPTRTPGGSSGGSAVAVASRMVPLALGSDTGGSVRQPAAFCGVYGLKPSYGRVSRHGLVAFGSSLDVVAPLARSVRDLELAMEVLSGEDPLDSTCHPLAPLQPERPAEVARLSRLRIGVSRDYFEAVADSEVEARCRAALAELEKMGAELVDVSLPHTPYAIPTYYVVATAEASSNLARFDGVAFGRRVEGDGTLQGMFAASRSAGFGSEVKRRILLGTYVLSAGYQDQWYGRAQRVRTLLRRDFEAAFAEVDLVVGPTTPTTAFELGERHGDPLAMYQSDLLTVPSSLAGLPALSVPVGFAQGERALPVGLQLIGPALSDARLLRVAAALEAVTGHARERAPLAAGSAT